MVAPHLFHPVAGCRICGETRFAEVLDLGFQALTGRFPASGEADAPEAPLEVIRCLRCGLVQLRHSVDTAEMFGENYGYRSGINATMREHLGGIAAALSRRAGLGSGDIVLDIGCNDGTLLASYPVDGLRRIGIDPIADTFRKVYPPDLVAVAGFFDANRFAQASPGGKARAVTSISMVYDLEDPTAFAADVAAVLASDGIWVLEQSYLPLMLARNAFDTVCHEHLEYYALAQIEGIAGAAGLRVFDVALNDINGGSFQIWACHEAASHEPNQASLEALRASEAELNLASDAPFAAFRQRVEAGREAVTAFLRDATARGLKVYGYGASTKGNVLLQHFAITPELLAGIADRNPAKWGRRTPGTGIPIVSEEDARDAADVFLVLPWHFRDEFVRREAEFLARGGRMVFPLPEFSVVR